MPKSKFITFASLGLFAILSACDNSNTSEINTVPALYTATDPAALVDGEGSKTPMVLEISDVQSFTVSPP